MLLKIEVSILFLFASNMWLSSTTSLELLDESSTSHEAGVFAGVAERKGESSLTGETE